LATQSTYRHLLATFLLALYAFIATPVQLWHHHQYPVKVVKTTPSNAKSDTVAAGTGISLETDCAVCSHKYSSYNDEVLAPYETSLTVIAVKNGCYSLQQVTASPASLLNKGPPALS
jgi:hypothetical protein